MPLADADIDGVPLEKDNIDGEPCTSAKLTTLYIHTYMPCFVYQPAELYWYIAQLVEHLPRTQYVVDSNPQF